MIENTLLLVLAGALVVSFYLYGEYFNASGLRELEKWADQHGFTILHSELRNFKTGPFFFSSRSKLQRVFYITLEDRKGNRRKAWIKIGGIVVGLFSDRVQVVWENS